ncbi:MAG: hypothetical protein NT027_12455 [Proteobacteria bacterium]|nr:hypothetical protein [Pseudomonadota bacterium]
MNSTSIDSEHTSSTSPVSITSLSDQLIESTVQPGVFLLREESYQKNVLSESTPNFQRQGATWSSDIELLDDQASSLGESDEANWPMIIWLRGDEPYFSQFDLDAEGVMKRLGIKRSRLTQISGKDLRVGRIRVDRYIKPIFRSQDVENYLTWTRATASHLKSSNVLSQAAGSLQEQSHQFAKIVETAQSSLAEGVKSAIESSLESFSKAITAQIQLDLVQMSNQFQSALQKNHSEMIDAVKSLSEINSTLQHNINLQNAGLEQTTLRLSEVQDRILLLKEKFSEQLRITEISLTGKLDLLDHKHGQFNDKLNRIALKHPNSKTASKKNNPRHSDILSTSSPSTEPSFADVALQKFSKGRKHRHRNRPKGF